MSESDWPSGMRGCQPVAARSFRPSARVIAVSALRPGSILSFVRDLIALRSAKTLGPSTMQLYLNRPVDCVGMPPRSGLRPDRS